MINTTIAHYTVTAKLGQGGMGEVYRATDTKLDREVAIKVLPESFAEDKERLARFEREAKVLAFLDHPNIGAIHGIEDADGKRCLILQLIEGETLTERLRTGAMPVDEALDVCKQIAEALEAAHEKGIIHRDLKPGNIKISPDGKVKVLDFGLAKAAIGESSVAPSDNSQSPTLTADNTRPGVILGTAAYMSPEQARAKPVDKRSDIWSFGCVLYECLTGKCLFRGEDVTETLATVIKGEPQWTDLPTDTPLIIQLLIRKCLVKDRRERLQDISDARVDLTKAIADPNWGVELEETNVAGHGIRLSRNQSSTNTWTDWKVYACVMVSAAVGWGLKPTPKVVTPAWKHSEILVRHPAPFETLVGSAFTLSKDGERLIYTQSESEEGFRIRDLASGRDDYIKGPVGQVSYPFFSWDESEVGYFQPSEFRSLNVVSALASGGGNRGQSENIVEFSGEFSASTGASMARSSLPMKGFLCKSFLPRMAMRRS